MKETNDTESDLPKSTEELQESARRSLIESIAITGNAETAELLARALLQFEQACMQRSVVLA